MCSFPPRSPGDATDGNTCWNCWKRSLQSQWLLSIQPMTYDHARQHASGCVDPPLVVHFIQLPRQGYLGLTQLLDENTDVLMLVTNSVSQTQETGETRRQPVVFTASAANAHIYTCIHTFIFQHNHTCLLDAAWCTVYLQIYMIKFNMGRQIYNNCFCLFDELFIAVVNRWWASTQSSRKSNGSVI